MEKNISIFPPTTEENIYRSLDYETYTILKKVNPPTVPKFEDRVQTDFAGMVFSKRYSMGGRFFSRSPLSIRRRDWYSRLYAFQGCRHEVCYRLRYSDSMLRGPTTFLLVFGWYNLQVLLGADAWKTRWYKYGLYICLLLKHSLFKFCGCAKEGITRLWTCFVIS